MKARLARGLVFCCFLLVLGTLFVSGGSIPTYASTLTQFKTSAMGTVRQYFVPFDDAHLWQLFVGKNQCHYQNTGATPQQPLVSYIFLTAGSDNTVYYYDHWEDGYDIDPLDPDTMTEIGVLDAGVTKLFQSDIYTSQLGTTFYYDGRDRITLLGEDGAVVRMAYPKYGNASGGAGTSLAAAWEVPGVVEWGTHYVATVGEDLDFNGPGLQADDHDYAGLEVMAERPNTQVYYNKVLVATLGTGETFFIAGANDDAGGGGVDSNDVITATAPIQVQMMTGGCNKECSAHGYTLQPIRVWAQEYWAPVPGFSAPCPDVDTDLDLHNFHSYPITVTVSSNMGAFDMIIPPATTLSVLHETSWADISTGASAVHLTSADTFWGVAVIDSSARGTGDSYVYDWAYSLIPVSELSSQVIVGYAPGNGRLAPDDNGNMAFVTAITDTMLYVDLTQDGLPDPFDINGDGDYDDYDQWMPAWDEPLSGMGIPIQAGQVIRVGDPNDQDLKGAIIYTKQLDEKIAVAWGQDPCWAGDTAPYLDLGYTILPLPIADLSKWDELAEDADVSGDISPGDILTYTLLLRNKGMGSMNSLVLTDTLPYTYTDFVVDSLRVDVVDSKPLSYTVEYYNGVWQTSPLTDAQMFRVTYPTFGARDTMTLTFRVQLHPSIPPTVAQITNRAMIDAANIDPKLSEDPDDPTDPDTDTDVGHPNLVITKQTALGTNIVNPGDHIPYTITVANIGSGAALNVVITDVLQSSDSHPPALRYVPGTLDITWPISKPKLVLETRVVSHTFSFKGYYADDFDDYVDGAPTTTLYTGDDGTLAWSTDWIEVNESDGPMSGDVQVRTNAGEALLNSAPAYLSLTDADGGNSGVRRQMDLEAFQEPLLRYYVFGDTDDAADQYQVSANGAPLLTQWYNGDYRLEEVPLTLYGGLPLTLTLWAWPELESDDVYRFDNFAIYEGDPERSITTTLKKAYKVFSYTVYHGASPLAYDVNTGQMIITEGLRLPAGQVITITFQAQAAVPLSDSLALTNTVCTAAENWPKGTVCAQAKSLSVQSRHQLTLAKSVVPPTVLSGDFLTYTLYYTATGDRPASGVVITDRLPVGVRFITATGGIAAASVAPAAYAPIGETTIVTWHLGTLLTATSGITLQYDAVTLVGQLDPDWASAWLTNIARLTSDAGVSATAMVTSRVEPSADLVLNKSSAPAPYVPGDWITYTLVVTNTGPFSLGAMTLTDNLPSAVETPLYAVSTGNYNPSTGRWGGATLIAGERVTLTIVGEVRADFVGRLINTAVVTPMGVLDPDVRNNHSTDMNPVTLIADLALLKSGVPDPYMPGDRITYTLVVTNYGPSAIAAFTLTDNLPSAVETPLYAVSAGDYDPSTGRWKDTILMVGERVTLTIAGEVKADFVGQLINTAVVTPVGALDPDVRNNRSTDVNPFTLIADLALLKSSIPDPYISGDRITYTLVVTNYGPSAVTAFTLTDNLPSAVETPLYAVSAGDYDPSTGRWKDTTLMVGERVTLTIAGEVKANFVGQLINTAVVTPIGVLDPDVRNNRSTNMNPRFLTADLAVAKHSAPRPYVSGARITYTLVVTNYGPSAVSALTLTDYLPASILTPTYYTAIGTYDSATGAWQGLYLNAGTHVTLTITGTVPQMFDGVLENIAQVATSQARDPNMTNNTAIDLNPGVPILEATKRDVLFTDVDNNGFPSPGDVLLYTITITNSGDISATDVSLSDMPDVNTILITNSVQTSRGRVLVGNDPGDATVEVDLTTLPGGGDNVAISFQVRVVDPLLEGVTEVANQGLVRSQELPVRLTDDPDTPQRGDSTKTPVMAAPKIDAYKRDTLAIDTDGNGVPSPGDTLLYEISIVNAGNQRATEVVFTDIIDAPGLSLIPGTVQTTAGVVISGNVQGDAGIVVAVGAMAGNGSTVGISFQAMIMNPLPAGVAQVANQGLVSSAELPFEPTDDPDTPDENDSTITPVVAQPKIDAYKRDLLLDDADHDGNFSPGDTLLYEITVVNRGDQVATGVVFQDMPDEHTALVVGSVKASRGTVISGNQAGDIEVSVDVGTLPEIGEEVYITFQVVISKHFPADITWVSNQGVIFSVEGPPVLTDDSDTPELDDPTRSLVVAEPELEAYKTAYLFADNDGNAAPSPGDTLVYRVTLVNMGNAAAEGVRLTDLMTDPYLSLVTGTVQVDQGTVVQGNQPGDTGLEVLVGTLPGYGSSVVISFQASVVRPMPSDITKVANQGVLSGLDVGTEPTDDPGSVEDDDPTYVLITRPVCHVEPDVYEADGFYDKAAEIETDGSALTHTFHIVNDEDWMKFYAWAERVYTMTTLNLDADVDTVLRLYDVDGRTLLARNDNYLLGHKASQVTWQAPENGWYYVQVTHSDPLYNPGNSYICGNHYQVVLDIVPCGVTQDVYEPDDVYANALLIPTDGTVRMRSFEVIADKDWMRFEALAGHVYTITTSRLGAAVDTVLSLYAKDGSTLLAENDDAAPDADVDNPNASRIVWTAPESGVYFVRVTHFDPAYDPHTAPICGNEYSIAVKTLLCSLVDSYEPDSPRRAITIPINAGVLTRTFNMVADKDWGRFYAYAGQTYTVTTSRLDMDVDTVLQLYDTDGRRLLAENDDYADQSLGASRIVWTAPMNGWYFVRTTHFDPTYDPRYAVMCGGRYAVSVAQDVLGIEKFVAHQGAPQLAPDPMPPANFYISGDVITYTIAVWNKTDAPQTGLVITDYIPVHTTYVAGSESLATSDEAILGEISGPDPLVVRVGALTPRARITFTFQVLIDRDVVGRRIINQGEIRSDQQSEPLYTPPVITPVYSRLYIPIIIKTPRTRTLK